MITQTIYLVNLNFPECYKGMYTTLDDIFEKER